MTEGLYLSDENRNNLMLTSKWGKIIAIAGYIIAILSLFSGLMMIISAIMLGKIINVTSQVSPLILYVYAFIIIGCSIFYVFPLNRLFKMCKNYKDLSNAGLQMDFDSGLDNMAQSAKLAGYSILGMVFLTILVIFMSMTYAIFFNPNTSNQTMQMEDNDVDVKDSAQVN